jgi:hypothetical protein
MIYNYQLVALDGVMLMCNPDFVPALFSYILYENEISDE